MGGSYYSVFCMPSLELQVNWSPYSQIGRFWISLNTVDCFKCTSNVTYLKIMEPLEIHYYIKSKGEISLNLCIFSYFMKRIRREITHFLFILLFYQFYLIMKNRFFLWKVSFSYLSAATYLNTTISVQSLY